jgi:putative ABC transport system permease protein
MIRAFWKLTEVNPGYRPGGLLTLRINLPQATYPKTENVTRFWQLVEDKVSAIPGVTAATPMSQLPPERPINANDTYIEGFNPVQGGPGHNIDYWQFTGEKFFETLGTRLVEGRLIDSRDVADSMPAMVINQTMARTYYGDQSPLGKHVRPGGLNSQSPWFTVVGVVEDIKNAGLDKPAGTELFIPFRQQGFVSRTLFLVMRTANNPAAMISPVRAAIRDIDPSLPLSQVRTMDEVMDNVRSRPKFLTSLLGIFSSVALVLAAVGLYGVISYSVARRTTEFGVRMAMGAQTGDVLRLVVRQGLTLALFGVGLGAAGAIGLTRLMRSNGLLFEVSAFDPATFISMAIVLVAVTALACMVPARRATRVDPLVALRYE